MSHMDYDASYIEDMGDYYTNYDPHEMMGHQQDFRYRDYDSTSVKGIYPRGNNNMVIILFHVYDKCLFRMLELY